MPASPVRAHAARARLPGGRRCLHPEPFKFPNRRGAAARPSADRRRGPAAVRPRRLRDARCVPAGSEGRRRLPYPGHRGEHRRADRDAVLGARGAGRARRAARGRCRRTLRGAGGVAMKLDPVSVRSSLQRPKLWQLYLLGGFAVTALYVFVPPFRGSGPVDNLIGLSGVIALVVGIMRHRPKARLAWWLLVIALALYWAGDLYTYTLPRVFGVNVPFPSPGDAIYLTVYPVQMAGLFLLVRRRNPKGDRAAMIDSLIMTLGLALIIWVVLISPYIRDNTLPLLPKLVSVAYPLGDTIVMAALIRLAVGTGKRQP